ncbi:MAG: transposase [Verrucomicrobiota bacterium]|nr:transposase [Verrucomicrobiota bacterium]
MKSITLANACKVRLIAEAQIKTDKIDARKLALLLRMEVVPSCHIPNRAAEILSSIPGIGLIIASIMAAETDGIGRFPSPERYTDYSGLSPTTHSSGGHTHNGRMTWMCNKWLKWAFIEAAWVAVGSCAYFGGMYRQHRQRGKKANTAITIVARRMCRIVYRLLKEDRFYEERTFSPVALVKV